MSVPTIRTLPPELVDRILDFMAPKSNLELPPEMEATKRQYSQCALTCYLFASRCQLQLFRRITLRCSQDLRDLVTFLTWSDRPWIAEAVQILCSEYQYGIGPPWVHLIATTVWKRLPNLREVQLTMKADPAQVPSQPRRIHDLLPRSVPQNIAQLALTGGIHFPDLRAMFRLLNSLPTLERLACTDVSWGTAPDPLPRLRTSYRLARVEALACTDWWPFLWIALAPKGVPTPRWWPHRPWTSLAPEELAALREMVGALVAGIAAARWSVVFEVRDPIAPNSQRSTFAAFDASFYSHDEGQRDLRVAPSMHAPLHQQGTVMRITGIQFGFNAPGLVFEDALRCDWARIGRVQGSLAHLTRVAFGLESVEDYERFIQEKRTAFEHLDEGMVRYAVRTRCAAPYENYFEWIGQGELKDRVMIYLLD